MKVATEKDKDHKRQKEHGDIQECFRGRIEEEMKIEKIMMGMNRKTYEIREKFVQSEEKAAIVKLQKFICLKADSRFGWPNNFEMFHSYFLLKKENYPISAFVFSTKKSPKVVNLPLTDETLCLRFWRHKQDKSLFQFSKLSWGSYVSL